MDPQSLSSIPSHLRTGDDPSSFSVTDTSTSLHLPMVDRPQDAGKFISKSTVRSLSLLEVNAKLYPIQTQVESCLVKIREIASKMQWVSATCAELASYSERLNSIEVVCNASVNSLFSTDGMIEYIGAMQESRAIAPIIATIQTIALDMLVARESIVELRSLSQEPHFVARIKDQHSQGVAELLESIRKSKTKPNEEPAYLVLLKEVEYLANEPKNAEYSFWNFAGWWAKKQYDWGWYIQTGEVGQKLEEVIGAPLGKFLVALKGRLHDFCQGRFSGKFGYEDALDEYNLLHKGCLDALEKALGSCFEMVCTISPDGLSKTLIAYAYGLETAVKEARSYLNLYYRAIEERSCSILLAMEGVRNFYSGAAKHAKELYPAAQSMQFANKLKPNEKSQNSFDLFLYRTVTFLNEVHAKQDPKILALSAAEARVGALLLAKAFPGIDSQEALADVVVEYCVKRMMQYLFLPVDEDIELELVLHLLRRDYKSQYLKSFDAVEDVKKVVIAYDGLCAEKRQQDIFDKALQIAYLIACAGNSSQKGPLFYAEAWQKLFDLKIPINGQLYKELAQRLALVDKQRYSPIFPAVQKATIDAFKVDNTQLFKKWIEQAAFDVTTVLPGALDEEKFQTVFTAVHLRILGASLFAEDVHEMANAHLMKYQLLSTSDYEVYVNAIYSDPMRAKDMNTLLLQSALQSMLVCNNPMLSDREQTLVNHAIDQYLNKKQVAPEDKALELVVYKRMQSELALAEDARPITQKYKACRTPSESEREMRATGQVTMLILQ